MLAGQRLQGVGGQGVGIEAVPQRRLDAVIVAVGVGAGLRCAFAVLLQADFVFGSQSHAAQLQIRVCCAQQSQCIFCCRAGRAPGRQVKNRPAFPHGFQCREQHTHRLADTGGSLAEQLAALGAGLVHGVHHSPLTGAVACKRKWQCLPRCTAHPLPLGRALGPGRVLRQQVGDDGVQRVGGVVVMEGKFQILIHLIVNQPHPHGGQPLLASVDGRVDLRLRPVLGALLAGDEFRRQRRGLDLINGRCAVLVGKDAIGAAFQRVGNAGAGVVLP